MLFICQFPLHSTSVLVLQLNVYLPMYLNSSLFYCFSCCQTSFCRHHSGPITFFPTFCEPISLCPMCFKSQHSSIILSFSFSFMQPASSPSPRHPGRTHCCTSLHLLHLCHREYLHSRGPVLFPTTVGLCYLALSESNHQIFYYSLFNKSCSVPSN